MCISNADFFPKYPFYCSGLHLQKALKLSLIAKGYGPNKNSLPGLVPLKIVCQQLLLGLLISPIGRLKPCIPGFIRDEPYLSPQPLTTEMRASGGF